jgi:hypothetical protein
MSPKTIAIVSAILVIAGGILAAIATATALDVTAIFLFGLGFVGLVSAAFYAIGLSEDRARADDRNPR